MIFCLYRQLITHLKVFSKFVNPRSVYLERSLSELYHQVTPPALLSKKDRTFDL